MITDDQNNDVENMDSEQTLNDVIDSKGFDPQSVDPLVNKELDLNTNHTICHQFSNTQIAGKFTSEDVFPTYNMNYPRRGKCLIFNQEDFSQHSGYNNRDGTDIDCQSLERTFSNLGFELEIHKDLKLVEVMNVLKKASEEDHGDAACFVCCVLSHGEEGELFAKDKRYDVDKLWDRFVGVNCPSLIGKPKLFFIQACQGGKTDKGVDVPDGPSVRATIRIPNHADFLIARATVPGHVSWRNPVQGSWFMQALCECLNRHISEDIQTILTAVAFKVSHEFISSEDRYKPKYDKCKQMPSFLSMLTKKLYLTTKSQ